MPTVSALRPDRHDRVSVELDGQPWRALPAAAVVAVGLRVGLELDRSRARELGRAVRRAEALARAAGALARRDLSAGKLDAVLARGGVRAPERLAAVEKLVSLGYLDEPRLAERRAQGLAERGYGDEAIRFRLEGEQLSPELIAAALERLAPESERARGIAAGLPPAKAFRLLTARGFAPETLEAVLGVSDL